MRHFRQVDVFSSEYVMGNPVAVVHGADAMSDAEMAAFARWTNLSETTFLLEPTDPRADYRVRIFTGTTELPFAGHPTLGTAHAWLDAGGTPAAQDGRIVQECGVGLVSLRRTDGRLAFAAPERMKAGPVEEDVVRSVAAALEIPRAAIVDAEWCDNGPGWVGVRLATADEVLALRPDPASMQGLKVGVVGLSPQGAEVQAEVRAFFSFERSYEEDPVTGSLNAALGQWLIADGTLPASYVAAQGTAMGRRGRIHVDAVGDEIWVGGDTRTTIVGTVDLR